MWNHRRHDNHRPHDTKEDHCNQQASERNQRNAPTKRQPHGRNRVQKVSKQAEAGDQRDDQQNRRARAETELALGEERLPVIEQKTYNLFQESTPVTSALSVTVTMCDRVILIVHVRSRKRFAVTCRRSAKKQNTIEQNRQLEFRCPRFLSSERR